MALNRVWIPSPNYSSRGGTKVRLVVVHTAEGALTYQSLGSFFANPSSGVSSQTGIDDTPNTCGEYVRRDMKPWTQANANPYSTATELCAFAKWDTAEWNRHPVMLENCRQWINEECAHFGIPKVKLTAAQAQGGSAGVCGHVDLGAAGGGHWDPGPGFPWATVLGGAVPPTTQPTPPPSGGGAAPPWPGTYLRNFTQGGGTRQWQQQMRNRGWSIGVDDMYGSESERVCRQFQAEKGLSVDGVVGPQTWGAAWTAPVT